MPILKAADVPVLGTVKDECVRSWADVPVRGTVARSASCPLDSKNVPVRGTAWWVASCVSVRREGLRDESWKLKAQALAERPARNPARTDDFGSAPAEQRPPGRRSSGADAADWNRGSVSRDSTMQFGRRLRGRTRVSDGWLPTTRCQRREGITGRAQQEAA